MQNETFIQLLSGYKEWITRLNYAQATQKSNCRHLAYFLNWCEVEAIESLEEIEPADYELYLEHLKTKTHRGRALSNSTLLSYFNVLKHVNQYLESYGKPPIIKQKFVRQKPSEHIPVVLSRYEVQELYDACGQDETGLRSRAMLTLYYGCGLRFSEGANLKINDVDLQNGWIHVRKGKYYLERYVPLTEIGITELHNYLKYARWFFLFDESEWFLLSNQGKKAPSSSTLSAIKRLGKKAEINKEFTLHGLRHSIATHLLENGMKLERIQQFLGHRHLKSTQVYTHIVEQNRVMG